MEGLLDDADDVALSADGNRDHDASYQERFCFYYGEPEWLLVHPTGGCVQVTLKSLERKRS
jgi:hypothetical protein